MNGKGGRKRGMNLLQFESVRELGRDENKKSWWVFQLERDTNNVIRNGKQRGRKDENLRERRDEGKGERKKRREYVTKRKDSCWSFIISLRKDFSLTKKNWRRRWGCKERRRKKERERKSDGKTNMPVDEYYWRLTELELKSKRREEGKEFNEKEREKELKWVKKMEKDGKMMLSVQFFRSTLLHASLPPLPPPSLF